MNNQDTTQGTEKKDSTVNTTEEKKEEPVKSKPTEQAEKKEEAKATEVKPQEESKPESVAQTESSTTNEKKPEASEPKTESGSQEESKKEENKQPEEAPPKKKGKNFNLDDYISMMLIGSGNFSEIYMVEHKVTKILYAMKTFSKMRVEQLHKQEDVLMEKHVMEKIPPHKNIIGYYGSSKDELSMYILYEYINGGDLWKRCVVYGHPCEMRIKYYFLQLLNGIKHMHSCNVPHRDIKPENILITKDETTVKIIDFGSSTDLDGTEFSKKFDEEREKQKYKKPHFKHFVGTPNFMAPECVHNQYSDKRCDYWSLGCVLYNMYTGFPPFLGASEYLIFQKSIEGKYIFPPGIIPPLAEDFIRKCIVLDSDKRMTIEDMYKHEYLKDVVNDENFLNVLPQMTKEEEEFYNIRKSILEKYGKYKQHSSNLDAIKQHEMMEEDLKRNEIKPEPTENDKIMKELVGKKHVIKGEYDEAMEQCVKEINSHRKEDKEENKKFNSKIDFLVTQVKHDIFNIIYRGYEEPEKPEKDSDSDSKDSKDSK